MQRYPGGIRTPDLLGNATCVLDALPTELRRILIVILEIRNIYNLHKLLSSQQCQVPRENLPTLAKIKILSISDWAKICKNSEFLKSFWIISIFWRENSNFLNLNIRAKNQLKRERSKNCQNSN